jgi:transposase
MKNFRSYDRSQRLLLPPDLNDWVADDDLAHFIVEAVERIDMRAFSVSRTGSGKAQYHPRMMLGLLVYCYANGIFSSRKIEQATYRNVSVRFIAANTHPDHDTIAKFRRDNGQAFQAAFAQILLLAKELNILKVGMVSIDGTKIDANASKIKSLRYDRIEVLRARLEADIADLMAKAQAADCVDIPDGLNLPNEIARRQSLKDKLDAAAKRLEEAAKDDDDDNNSGNPGKDPIQPKAEKQTNLSDPDSAIMRKSSRHEYRQAYNAQAIVDADGSALILDTNVLSSSNDRQQFDAFVGHLCDSVGKPSTLLADAGYAGEQIVAALDARDIEPLIAVSRQQAERPYDFRPPKKITKPPPKITAPWRIAMQEKLQTDEAKNKYRKRKQTVEPVFGIIKSVLGFTQFHLRGIENVKNEWTLIALAHNCKRLSKLGA